MPRRTRTYSSLTEEAMILLGQQIRLARKSRRMVNTIYDHAVEIEARLLDEEAIRRSENDMPLSRIHMMVNF